MAILNKRRKENVEGNFYVDSTCIDCETCRILAPEVFQEKGDGSAVYSQPSNQIEQTKALQALATSPCISKCMLVFLGETNRIYETTCPV